MKRRRKGTWVLGMVMLMLAAFAFVPAADASQGTGWTAVIKPANHAQDVDPDALVTLVFPDKVKAKTGKDLTNSSIPSLVKLVNSKKRNIPYTAKWDSGKKIITIDPVGDLEAGERFTVTLVENKLKDGQGRLNRGVSSTFTTKKAVDKIAPVATILPGHGAKSVKLDEKVTIQFAEPVMLADGTALSSKLARQLVEVTDKYGKPVAHSVTWNKSKRTLTIKPKGKWQPHSSYQIDVRPHLLKDEAGNRNPGQRTQFTTAGK
ncbi:Ig-like domain-containing protein [Brevibacillus composti]|uniref:Ig-like domain-containing protein n=1 Tax=Brevibacillus composti TaxID=2796470 RepID=A0A7T5JNR1_9BACL|nr:Ig-like domain-containing protein [Brevibacillus composti]QQE74444.1 Ig-like domain-containing protein [Brevibacillus composti]QUO41526.1 Ig-like domain-containing protein [Brevibacillus composti]